MPKISVKKEHRAALEAIFSDKDGVSRKTWDWLRDLRDRIAAAYDEPELAERGMSLRKFITIAVEEMGEKVGLPPEAMRTPAWYGKMGSLLAASGLTEETSRQLCAYVATWAKKGMGIETLLMRSASFIASAVADSAVKKTVEDKAPEVVDDKGLFDD